MTLKKFLPLAALSMALVGLSACTINKTTEQGEKVLVVKAEHVASCKKLGKTIVQAKKSFIGINVPESQLKKELISIARNDAAKMGGDTIIPASEIKDGAQTFNIYLCKKD